MTTRSRRGLLLVLLTAAALVAPVFAPLALATPATGPAQEDPEVPAPPAALTLVNRAPWVAAEGDASFVVSVANAPDDATIRVRLHDALDDVAELEASATEDVGRRVFRSPHVPLDELPIANGTDRVVTVSTSESFAEETARIRRPGVHPVVISLHDADGAVLDELRTPLLRLGDEDDPLVAPRLAILLDVSAPPSLRPDGTRVVDPDRLAELEIVSDLLAAHPGLSLSTAVVPDTLEALAGSTEPAAATLVDRLAAADTLAAPYLPLAIESLLATDLIGFVPPLLDRGRATLTDLTGREPRPGIWDPAADLGDPGASLLAELGFDHLVVESEELHDPDAQSGGDPDGSDESGTGFELVDAGPVELAGIGPLQALVVDRPLSDALAAAPHEGVDAPHRAMAELLLRDDEQGLDLLVRPEPATRSVLADLLWLLDAADAPIEVGGVGLLVDPVPDEPDDPDGAGDTDDEPPALEWRGGIRPDLSGIAQRVLDASSGLDTFAATIDPASTRADDLRLQLATAIAAPTRSVARDLALDIVEATVRDAFAAIRLSGRNDVNLTSRRGTLPLTIENRNAFEVTVVLRIRSDRLAFPDGEVLTVTVGQEPTRIDVPVEALATGSVPVFVELWTVDDRRQLDSRQLNVRSTAISGVGLALSLGALAVLLAWWVRNWRRSRADRD